MLQDIVVSSNYSVAGSWSFIGLSCSRQNLAVGILLDYRVVDIILRQEFYSIIV